MDPREVLAIQLQRGQATAHPGRQVLSGIEAQTDLPSPGQAFGVDLRRLLEAGPPLWVWLVGGAAAVYLLTRER